MMSISSKSMCLILHYIGVTPSIDQIPVLTKYIMNRVYIYDFLQGYHLYAEQTLNNSFGVQCFSKHAFIYIENYKGQ